MYKKISKLAKTSSCSTCADGGKLLSLHLINTHAYKAACEAERLAAGIARLPFEISTGGHTESYMGIGSLQIARRMMTGVMGRSKSRVKRRDT